MLIPQFPHCDPCILHAPGKCEYCDLHPEWQELRRIWEINFTGEDDPAKRPCPAILHRPLETIEKWGGNTPKPVTPPEPPKGMHLCPRREGIGGIGSVFELPEWDSYIDDRCSYCGSLSGDSFMSLVIAGFELGPTDKNYKVYVHGGPFTKFYFQHLSVDQRKQFVELLNKQAVKIGMPGYFYTTPFFIRTN